MPILLDIPLTLDVDNFAGLREISRQVILAVHERDHYTCRCCGFRATKYQQILNCGGNWRDLDTITTACIFCQQCFSLEAAGEMRSGVLLSLPDLEQAKLNRLAIEIYLARATLDAFWVNKANSCLDFLMQTRAIACDRVGTDRPAELAVRWRPYIGHEVIRKTITKNLADIRLFPLDRRIICEGDLEFNEFPQILTFWRSKVPPYSQDESPAFPALDHFIEDYL